MTGCVISGVTKEVQWCVEELPHQQNKDQFEFQTIRDVLCENRPSLPGKLQCTSCDSSCWALFKRCTNSVNLRDKSFHPRTRNDALERSTLLTTKKIQHQASKLHSLQKYCHTIFRKLSDTIGVDIPINKSSDYFFSNETSTNHLSPFLGQEVTQDSLAYYIFHESV